MGTEAAGEGLGRTPAPHRGAAKGGAAGVAADAAVGAESRELTEQCGQQRDSVVLTVGGMSHRVPHETLRIDGTRRFLLLIKLPAPKLAKSIQVPFRRF